MNLSQNSESITDNLLPNGTRVEFIDFEKQQLIAHGEITGISTIDTDYRETEYHVKLFLGHRSQEKDIVWSIFGKPFITAKRKDFTVDIFQD